MARSAVRLRPVAVLGASVVAATSMWVPGAVSAGDGDVTLTFLSSFTTGQSTGDEFNVLAEQFAEETGIGIEVEEAATADIADRFEASALAGEEADIVILNLTPETADWLPDELVVDVSGYLDEWGLREKLQPGGVEYWSQGGEGMYGFPYIGFNWPIWYNMELLGEVGIDTVPATFDELLAAAAALREAGIQPFALGGAEWPGQNFTTWMVQQFMQPEATIELFETGGYCDNTEAMRGLELFAQLRDADVFIDDVAGYTADQMTTAFFTGEAAMMPSGSWAYTAAPPEIAEVTQLGGFPVVAEGVYQLPTAFNGHSAGFFISTNGAEKIDAVEQFITYMFSEPVLQGWVTDASQILSVTAEALGDAEASNPLVLEGNQLTDSVVDYLVLPDAYLPVGTDWSPIVADFLSSDQSAADFCGVLDEQYED